MLLAIECYMSDIDQYQDFTNLSSPIKVEIGTKGDRSRQQYSQGQDLAWKSILLLVYLDWSL